MIAIIAGDWTPAMDLRFWSADALAEGVQCAASRFFRHVSEQYLTSSQTFAHFFRHENGRLQVRHIFVGKLSFLCGILDHGVLKGLGIGTDWVSASQPVSGNTHRYGSLDSAMFTKSIENTSPKRQRVNESHSVHSLALRACNGAERRAVQLVARQVLI